MTPGVPVQLTTFVGRRRELTEGRRMLRTAPLVTLVGPGGVGKTRLAQRLTHQVDTRFRDGVAWVDLASQQDPASVASQVSAALGLDPKDQSAEAVLTSYVRFRQLLIVLDNCEHLVEACQRLATTLLGAGQNLRMLATSRQPLGLAVEHLMTIEPLSVPTSAEAATGRVGHIDAVALLTDRARAHDPRFRVDASNAEHVALLCRRLDGIPLAIELAAPRLKVLSVGQIVDRLDARFHLLSAGSRTALPRHQTLRGLVEWSYELCSPEEQRLWARLSVFDGGAELEAVEAVCGEPGASTTDLLDGLVDKSVVTVLESGGRVRFRMLETIRELGAERLAEHVDTHLTRDRHCAYFVGLARDTREAWFGPDQLDVVARVGSNLGNLRSALDFSLGEGADTETALRLVTLLRWYWTATGLMDEGMRWFERALAGATDSMGSLHALTAAAWLAAERNDPDTATDLAGRALATRPEEGGVACRASQHRARALLASGTGDHDTAVEANSQALAAYAVLGDRAGQVEHLAMLGIVTMWLGRHDESAGYLDAGLQLCDLDGERYLRAELLTIQGDLLCRMGDHHQGLVSIRAALSESPVLHTSTVANALQFAVRIHTATGEHRRAAVLLGGLRRVWTDLDYGPGLYVQDTFEATEKELHDVLGEPTFRGACAEGFVMSLDEAVQFALGPDWRSPAVLPGQTTTLSTREQQVAELLARGMSNKEIAEELVISQRTAEGHVAKVMNKLGVHSRDEVVTKLPPPREPGQE